MAENAFSGSTDVDLIVSKTRYSFSRLSGLFFVDLKRLLRSNNNQLQVEMN